MIKKFLVVKEEDSKLHEQYYTLSSNNFTKSDSSQNLTYTSILQNSSNEIINKLEDTNYKQVNLDKTNTISIRNEDYELLKKKYTNFKNYFIFSPFHVLLNNIKLSNIPNSLNLFYYENSIYMIILNQDNKIIFYSSNDVSNLDETIQTDFFDKNNLDKFYYEMIQLELDNLIKKNINIFYQQDNSFFIEIIQIFSDELFINEKSLLIKTVNSSIDIDETLLRTTQKELNYGKLSYTHIEDSIDVDIENLTRGKKDSKKRNYKKIIFLFIVIFLGLLAYLYYPIKENAQIEPVKPTTPVTKQKKEITVVNKVEQSLLPDHIITNNRILNRIKNLFNAIPYNMYIDLIVFNQDNSIMNIQYLHSDTFIKNTNDKLKEIYAKSLLKDQVLENNIYKAIILNSGLISNLHQTKIKTKEYKKEKDINSFMIQNIITNILPKDSQIKYNKKLNQKDLTFAFEANILVEDPEEFYKIIKKINNIDKSLSISYPLTFTNSNSNLDIKFIIHYYKSL
jgi:hypothetical protein